MHLVRARCLHLAPRVSGPRGPAPRRDVPVAPTWRLLAVALVLGMAAWAVGLFELPDYRRLSDWIGGLTVLTILVVWARTNGAALACRREVPLTNDENRLQIRLVHSRRPPLPDIGGPSVGAPRHRGRRRGDAVSILTRR